MRAGDGDAAPPGHDRGQRDRPRQHPEPALPRRRQLGVVRADGGRDDDGVGVPQVRGVVPDLDPGTQRPQGQQRRGVPPVAAGDADAAGQQDAGDAAHPGPADAHEVHRAQLVQRRHRVGPGGHVSGAHALADLQHDVGQPLVGVGDARCRGVPGVPVQRRRVGEQRHQVRLDPGRRQVGVLDQQPATGIDDRQRVAPLLAVADRQGHERRGQADRRELRHGHRARPAQGEVGGGVGEVHALQIVHDDVRRTPGRARRHGDVGVLGAPGVQHLHARGGERVGGADGRPVQRRGALRASDDQQGRAVGVQPELGTRLGPAAGPVQRADRRPQGHADVLAAVQRGAGHGDRHPGGDPGPDPVGQPRQRVLLVDDDRNAGPAARRGRPAARRSRRTRRRRRRRPRRAAPASRRRRARPGPGRGTGRGWACAAAAPAGSAAGRTRGPGPAGSPSRGPCRDR